MDNARVASPATDPQGEIIVTAWRRAEKLQDVPLAVSVMTQDQLKTQPVHDQNDLKQKIPSIRVDSRFGHTGGTHAQLGLSGRADMHRGGKVWWQKWSLWCSQHPY